MHLFNGQLDCSVLRYSYPMFPMFQRLTRPQFDLAFSFN